MDINAAFQALINPTPNQPEKAPEPEPVKPEAKSFNIEDVFNSLLESPISSSEVETVPQTQRSAEADEAVEGVNSEDPESSVDVSDSFGLSYLAEDDEGLPSGYEDDEIQELNFD